MNDASKRILDANQGARKLLRHMLEGEKELVPEFDPRAGFRYPLAERLIAGSPSETQYVLRKLYEGGILLKKYRDKALACPSCLSPVVTIKYLCPFCNSSNIERENEEEFVVDELDSVSNIATKGGGAAYKRASRTLKDSGSNEIAKFLCKKCGKGFDKPTWMHNCAKCKLDFTMGEASFIDVCSYVLAENVKSELDLGALSISPIKEIFEKRKFETLTPGSLRGRIGTAFSFDLVARRRGSGRDESIVLDLVCSSDPLDPSTVSSFMGKLIDTGPEMGILVAISGLDSAAKSLAELYGIKVVEANSSSEAANRIEQLLDAKE
jgi:Zn finger protein HypA/HybF involved in hydrogenase expression